MSSNFMGNLLIQHTFIYNYIQLCDDTPTTNNIKKIEK